MGGSEGAEHVIGCLHVSASDGGGDRLARIGKRFSSGVSRGHLVAGLGKPPFRVEHAPLEPRPAPSRVGRPPEYREAKLALFPALVVEGPIAAGVTGVAG